MIHEWHKRFIELARHFASWSKDPSTKVGAVLIDEKHRVVGEGYNGFPRGIEDSPERLNDRPTKYALVVHAEVNAILNATRADLDDCSLYCTHLPCSGCAKLIIQAGIRRVFVPPVADVATWAEDQQRAMEMFREADVDVLRVNGV